MKRARSAPAADDAALPTATEAALLRLDNGDTVLAALERARAAAADAAWPSATRHAAEAERACWKALHTGPWADVPCAWRSAYMAAAFYLGLGHSEQRDGDSANGLLAALRAVDLGLMLGDTSLRRQLLDFAERLEERLEAERATHPAKAAEGGLSSEGGSSSEAGEGGDGDAPALRVPSGGAVPRLALPSLIFFFNECMAASRPAVLSGAMDGWPARSTRPWADLSYLKRVAGHRTVPVERGAHYLVADFDEQLMYLGDFIEEHLERPRSGAARGGGGGTPSAYLAQHRLFEQLPRLRADVLVPDYCALSTAAGDDDDEDDEEEEVALNAWLGPGGTVSPLHHDRAHNLLAQVVGSKYVRLYAPEHSARLYPHAAGPHVISSQIVDPDTADLARFPRFAGTPYVDLVLEAGEMLYIPPGWWHFIEARETSFSVSFWWGRA